ncbi:hypothetical protein [Nonomuraea helvata]|uniref:hypothetical protein n=1 Tax=Nonomuraea helvata TaxID=37484 RepID=UPI0031E94BE2
MFIQTGVAVALAATMMSSGLPDGMLFMESHPPPKQGWDTFEVTDSKALPLQLNPCFYRHRRDGGRLETRAALHSSEAEKNYEQLVVYKDVRYAERAMRLLRADLRRCADVGKGARRYRYFSKPLGVGDDGLRAGGPLLRGRRAGGGGTARGRRLHRRRDGLALEEPAHRPVPRPDRPGAAHDRQDLRTA